MEQPEPRPDALLKLVMLAVLIWGSAIALGVLIFGRNPIAGAAIVMACTLGFLGIWRLLIVHRLGRQSRRQDHPAHGPGSADEPH